MRLKKIIVVGLFRQFNHEIPLNLADRITIITSPNGYGKTMILRMVNALLSQSYFTLARIPFREFRLEFEDNVRISVHRKEGKSSEEQDHEKPNLKVELIVGEKFSQTFTPKLAVRQEQLGFPIAAIEDIIPDLDQIGSRIWRERGTGAKLSLEEVLDKYANELPLAEQFRDARTPEWLQNVSKKTPARFINTERLYIASVPRHVPYPHYRSHSATELAVRKYSEELGTTIKQTLSEYGTLSQALDRTFPARLVAEPPQPNITLTALRKKLEDIEAKRARLVEAGLLTQEPDQYYWGGEPEGSGRGQIFC